MIKEPIWKICEMLSAVLLNIDEEKANTLVEGVEIDSRKVKPGNLFVPLIGERTDGHSYIEQVKEAGASVSLWQKDHEDIPDDLPVILVEDTEKALQDLASAYLNEVNPKVIGITGSNGKTSAKDMVASILSKRCKTYKTQGNRNSGIGLPLTILEMDKDTQAVVLEMGMENYGEIEQLTKIAPVDLSMIVSIGSAHKENLGSKAGIARAKLEILQGTKPDGYFIYNADSKEIEEVLPSIKHDASITLIPFGKDCDNRIVGDIKLDHEGIHFHTSNIEKELHIPTFGLVQASNALAVITAAKVLGLTEDEIIDGLENMEMTKMRTDLTKIGDAYLLDDSYKSNPESARAAIDSLMAIPAKKHIAVLADMLDLGEDENTLHASVGIYALDQGVDEVLTYGERSVHTANAFGENGIHFENKEEIVDRLQDEMKGSVAVLVKGSRALAMDTIVKDLLGGIENGK